MEENNRWKKEDRFARKMEEPESRKLELSIIDLTLKDKMEDRR